MVWLHGTRKRSVQQGFLLSSRILSKNAPRCRHPSRSVAGGEKAFPAETAERRNCGIKTGAHRRRSALPNSCPSSVYEAQLFSAVMSALTASPPVCDIAERPHGRRRKNVLSRLVTENRSRRQPGSTRAPAGSPPPVRFPSSGYGALLSPPSAGSHLRAPLCSTVFPRPPASCLRPAPAPHVSVMGWPRLPILRKQHRQRLPLLAPFRRSRPACPPLSVNAPSLPSAPTARPPRRAVLFLFRPQRRKHFCRPLMAGFSILLYYQYVIDCFRKKFSFFPQDTLIPATTKAETFSTLM